MEELSLSIVMKIADIYGIYLSSLAIKAWMPVPIAASFALSAAFFINSWFILDYKTVKGFAIGVSSSVAFTVVSPCLGVLLTAIAMPIIMLFPDLLTWMLRVIDGVL